MTPSWLDLPDELVRQVLEQISFEDYVALTQTSRKYRATLEPRVYFQFVMHASFSEAVLAYDWSIDPSMTRAALLESLKRLRHFLAQVNYVLMKSPSMTIESGHLHYLLQQTFTEFATNEVYFFPIVSELSRYKSLERKSSDRNKIQVWKGAWLRKLLQLQNFSKAVKFWSNLQPEHDIERCYFELSRCYNDFDKLAPARAILLASLREEIRRYLPSADGVVLKMPYFGIQVVVVTILEKLLARMKIGSNHVGSGGNILRVYSGYGHESELVYLSIIAKILDEEFRQKFRIDEGNGVLPDIPVTCSEMAITVFGCTFLLDWKEYTCSFWRKVLLETSGSYVTRPITVSDVIRRSFDAGENILTRYDDLSTKDWTRLPCHTSKEKLRFLRTLLIPIKEGRQLDRGQLTPLLHKSDFFLYYYCAEAASGSLTFDSEETLLLLTRRYESFTRQLKKKWDHTGFQIGDLVLHRTLNIFGIISHTLFRREAGSLTFLLRMFPLEYVGDFAVPLDAIELVSPKALGDKLWPFLTWAMMSDGYINTAMFTCPVLRQNYTRIRFSQ